MDGRLAHFEVGHVLWGVHFGGEGCREGTVEEAGVVGDDGEAAKGFGGQECAEHVWDWDGGWMGEGGGGEGDYIVGGFSR